MPPNRAARAAAELARIRLAGRQRWLADVLGRDRLDEDRVLALLGRRGEDPGRYAGKLFRGPDVVLPLAPGALTVDAAFIEAVKAGARAALEHRFDLLGSGPVRVDYELDAAGLAGHRYDMAPGPEAAQRQRQRMVALLSGLGDDYVPIDWHRDFISGYRWDPGRWHTAVPYGHAPGVDTKVPWELSRFQHATTLGLAWRLAPDSPEGRAAPGEIVAQVVDWIAANPVGRGVNWAMTMDVALRAYSWLAALALVDDAPAVTPAFRWLLYRSLLAHAEHVEENLEYYAGYRGNHYVANLVGLVALGAALPEAPRSDVWLACGLQGLARELEHQVLPDGAGYEGSTAYHGFVAEMFLCAACIAVRLRESRRRRLASLPATTTRHPAAPDLGAPTVRGFDPLRPAVFPNGFWDRLRRMATLVVDMTKSDGRFVQVGDHDSGRVLRVRVPDDPLDSRQVPAVLGRLLDDDGLASAGADHTLQARLLVPAAVRGIAGRPAGTAGRHAPSSGPLREEVAGTRVTRYPRAGLTFVRAGPLDLAIACVVVPEGTNGGHIHNDLLSFELQWQGVDFVVDGGAYVYTPLPATRNAFRATAAHSTVVVDGVEQRSWPSAAVSLFQVTRDAAVRIPVTGPGFLEAEATYGGVVHRRRWEWAPDRVLVEDRVRADPPIAWRLNLAPGVEITDMRTEDGGGVVLLESEQRRCEMRLEGMAPPDVVEGRYSRGYGRKVETLALAARVTGDRCRARLAFVS